MTAKSLSYNICIHHTSVGSEQKQWDYALSHWPPDEVFIRGEGNWPGKPLRDARRVATAADLPDVPLVVMTPKDGRYIKGETALQEFIHPERCTYLFGSDKENLHPDDMGGRAPDHLVYIPTLTHHEMFSWVAGAIVMYDRAVALG